MHPRRRTQQVVLLHQGRQVEDDKDQECIVGRELDIPAAGIAPFSHR